MIQRIVNTVTNSIGKRQEASSDSVKPMITTDRGEKFKILSREHNWGKEKQQPLN